MKPFGTLDLETAHDLGGGKALASATQTALKNMQALEYNGVQVYRIAETPGWTLRNNVLTPLDAASRLNNYALVCTGTPAATAILPTPLDIWRGWVFLHIKFRFDANPTATKILYKRHTQTDNLFAFGLEMPANQFYLDIGTAARHYCALAGYQVGQWHDVVIGIVPVDGDTVKYIFDGFEVSEECSFTSYPTSTEDVVEVGCDGVSIAMLAVVAIGSNGTASPYLNNYTPTAKARPAYAVNYYNFRPGDAANQAPDLALDASAYKCDLTIVNGAIEAVEMV